MRAFTLSVYACTVTWYVFFDEALTYRGSGFDQWNGELDSLLWMDTRFESGRWRLASADLLKFL